MCNAVSVIVPVYKVEQYLKKCVDSILNQTHDNLEIILVDDGSPDSSGKICDDYAAKDSRIRVVHKENGGLSDARNAGLEISTGEYVAFIDSDDWVDVRYIEKLYALAMGTCADISVCNFLRTETYDIQPEINEVTTYEFSNIEALNQFFGKFHVQMTVSWGKLFNSSLFKEIRFPVGRFHEDEFVTYKLIYNAHKISLSTEQLYYYWQREDSLMGRAEINPKNALDVIDALEERITFFENINNVALKDKTIKKCFNFYKKINENLNLLKSLQNKEEFEAKFKIFKEMLRGSNQSLRFKLYYELYFSMPCVSRIMFKAYSKMNRILNKKSHEDG